MTKPSLLMTRPAPQSREFVARLDPAVMRGVSVVVSPLIDIVPTGAQPDLAPYAGVIFTSAQAVGLVPAHRNRDAYCVGARTADAAVAAGWEVRLTAETAAALVDLMRGARGPLIHLAGLHRRGDIAATLTDRGLPTDVVTLYDQQARDLTAQAKGLLAGDSPVILPLFSPRTAAQFAAQIVSAPEAIVVALSIAVAQDLGATRVGTIIVSPAPTAKEMASTVEKALVNASLP